MAQTLKFGNKVWAAKEESVLAYNDINNNYKPLPFSFSRASIGTRVNKDGLIETMGQDIARIDYSDSADGVLLLEPSSTNSITYSEDFLDSSWTRSSSGTGITPIITENYAISPDGSLNASRIQFDNGGGTSLSDFTFTQTLFNQISTASISIWMKSNNSNNYDIALRSNNFVVCNVTPKWQRFELNNESNIIVFQLILRGTYGTSNNADILIYGAQSENNSVATSYIPTSGSTVTRAAETCNNSGNSEVFNDSEGVLFANVKYLTETYSFNRSITISDSTINNRLQITLLVNGVLLVLYQDSSGSQTMQTTNNLAQFNKIALSYSSNSLSFYLNGIEVGNILGDFSSMNSLQTLRFDNTISEDLYGQTKELGYYDTILTDAELETLTSYRNWVSMVNELNLNIIYNG